MLLPRPPNSLLLTLLFVVTLGLPAIIKLHGFTLKSSQKFSTNKVIQFLEVVEK